MSDRQNLLLKSSKYVDMLFIALILHRSTKAQFGIKFFGN